MSKPERHYVADRDPDDTGLMPFTIRFLGDDEDQPWEIDCDAVHDTHETLDQLLFWNLILGDRFISEELRERINQEWSDHPPPDKQPAAETLEQVAGRIVATLQERNNIILPDAGWLTESILSALRNERERAVRIIDEHRALDVCEDNCWTTIKAAIGEGK